MQEPTIKTIAAIVGIAIIESIALAQGIDGMLLGTALTLLGAFGVFSLRERIK
jgi:UDP-N-acetylmuramyl pentapeptide phosphotransferase/UDP-N-acetylglucosamine-1-phosphate transferase